MAIVFISPKRRQRIFFWAVAVSLALVLLVVVLIMFPPSFLSEALQQVPTENAFIAPTISVNFKVMDSDKVKNLELMPESSASFSYTAKDRGGLPTQGQISANSQQEALGILSGMGLTEVKLTELNLGRTDPFIPYYQQPLTPLPAKK